MIWVPKSFWRLIISIPNVSDALVSRLQKGQQWLMVEHLAWLSDAPAADDQQFSHAFNGWVELEEKLRLDGYQDCIWGPEKSCPEDSPVLCDACVRNE